MAALGKLTEIGDNKGMTAEDRAQLNAIQNKNAMVARGAREANKQNMAARGMSGSGMEAVNSMIGDQGSATSNYMGGTEVAANAEKRALDAITNAGNLGGNIRSQDFGEAEKKAAAADRINQFNATNKNTAMAANVAAANEAKRNAVGMYDTDFEQRRKKLQGYSDTMSGVAGKQQDAGTYTGNAIAGAAALPFQAAAAFSDRRVKEDVAPAEPDIESFLAELKPSKWEYKDPQKYGSGVKFGVMAQDMEKSPVGKQFVSKDAEGVKRIDYGAAQGTMLAILKTLADRVDELEGGRHAS